MKSLNFVLGSVLSAVLLVIPALGDDDLVLESIDRVNSDSAFEQYVDIDLLVKAWEMQDAAGLVDTALQFAKGEKELFRQHNVFSSQKLFNTALRIAADKKDTVTLERLEKIAKATGDETFAEKIASTTKLSAASRSIVQKYLTDEQYPYNEFSYTALVDTIKRFQYIGDEKSLETFENELKQQWETDDNLKKSLNKEQVDSLVKLSGESRAAMTQTPKEETETAYELEKLSGESRQYAQVIAGSRIIESRSGSTVAQGSYKIFVNGKVEIYHKCRINSNSGTAKSQLFLIVVDNRSNKAIPLWGTRHGYSVGARFIYSSTEKSTTEERIMPRDVAEKIRRGQAIPLFVLTSNNSSGFGPVTDQLRQMGKQFDQRAFEMFLMAL